MIAGKWASEGELATTQVFGNFKGRNYKVFWDNIIAFADLFAIIFKSRPFSQSIICNIVHQG